jgi:mono/diheme cytochrome c family protein
MRVALIAILVSLMQPPPGNPDRGHRVFMEYFCYSCHGTDGQGGAGPRLAVTADADRFIRYVRKPTGGNMPAYTSKSIAEQDLRDIHAYLRLVRPSPSAKTIDLLRR